MSKVDPVDEFFESLVNDGLPALVSDAMMLFYEKPTLKSAKLVLSTLKIPQPLKMAINAKKKGRNLLTGGTGSLNDDEVVRDAVRELFTIDTLHDLAHVSDIAGIYKMIMSKRDGIGAVDFPKELKDLYLARSPLFTSKAAEYLCDKYGLVMTSAMSIEERRLVDQFISTRTYSKDRLEIVMDNLIANLHMGATMSNAALGLAACSYILILCNNLKKLEKIQNPREVILYGGWFQNFDGTNVIRFLGLYRKAVQRVTRSPKCIVDEWNRNIIPPYFNKYLNSDAVMKVYKNSAGEEFPYVEMHGKKYVVDLLGRVSDPALVSMCETVRFPHIKRVFVGYVETMKKQSRDLWYLNFLRDCLKAEMAMLQHAIYITHDRLAYLYYKLIGGENGFLLSVDAEMQANSVEQVVYKVTV